MRNKAAFARDVTALTRDRAGGLDYLNDDVGGFARRVSCLLGFSSATPNCTGALDKAGVSLADSRERTRSGVEDGDTEKGQSKSARKRALALMRKPGFARRLLSDGTRAEHYAMASSRSEPGVDVRMPSVPQSVAPAERTRSAGFEDASPAAPNLDTCATREDAKDMVRELARLATQLCRASEGLHVVEHVLLRPACAGLTHVGCDEQAPGNARDEPIGLWQTFYPLRFSVFFPDWTARCQDPSFRELAEETVHINSPSHVYGQCFWLSFNAMRKLEQTLTQWRAAWRKDGAKGSTRDKHAMRLIQICLKNGWQAE